MAKAKMAKLKFLMAIEGRNLRDRQISVEMYLIIGANRSLRS